MTALEKIFQGYYEGRLEGDKPDPVEMRESHARIMRATSCMGDVGYDVLEDVSTYGMQAEKAGFMAGFRMAWELLKNMQEGAECERA